MINSGREWDWMDDNNTKAKVMIYRNIEKVILETPNDMELGKKIRELYYKEVVNSKEEEWDEDHALDLVMNDIVKDLTEEDLKEITKIK
jgi:hypothetical protein